MLITNDKWSNHNITTALSASMASWGFVDHLWAMYYGYYGYLGLALFYLLKEL